MSVAVRSVVAILLAAGSGRRLGGPKAALQVRDRWMLPRLVHALRRGGATEVRLVLSAAAERAIADLGPTGADRVHRNPHPERGRTGSLLCALEDLPDDLEALLVHPCDVPLLSAEMVTRLLQAWRHEPHPERLLARPITASGRGGHPLLIGAERLSTLRGFAPNQPLRELVHEDPSLLLNLTVRGNPGPFLDVNTPEQLQLLESLLEPSA